MDTGTPPPIDSSTSLVEEVTLCKHSYCSLIKLIYVMLTVFIVKAGSFSAELLGRAPMPPKTPKISWKMRTILKNPLKTL